MTKIDVDYIVTKYISFFEKFNLNENKIRSYYNSTWKSNSLAQTDNDFLWHLFNLLLDEIAKQATDQKMLYEWNLLVYKEMWAFMIQVENKNGNHVKKLMHESELNLWNCTQTIECKMFGY